MTRLDPKVTAAISDWLNVPPAARDIAKGAQLLLSLNRNRALYNSIMRKPRLLASKLEYELRKYLRIRLHDASVSDLKKVEAEVMPRVSALVTDAPVISVDQELPQASVARGRRQDHDSLPDSIRALWDTNAVRYRKIVLLFNELKAMSDSMPCDRLEKLLILDETEAAYRKDMAAYDAYDATAPAPVEEAPEVSTEDAVIAARKNVSKYRKALASTPRGSEKYYSLVRRLEGAVAVVIQSGGSFTPSVLDDLRKYVAV